MANPRLSRFIVSTPSQRFIKKTDTGEILNRQSGNYAHKTLRSAHAYIAPVIALYVDIHFAVSIFLITSCQPNEKSNSCFIQIFCTYAIRYRANNTWCLGTYYYLANCKEKEVSGTKRGQQNSYTETSIQMPQNGPVVTF